MENKDFEAGCNYEIIRSKLNNLAGIFNESPDNQDLFKIYFLEDMRKDYQKFLNYRRKT